MSATNLPNGTSAAQRSTLVDRDAWRRRRLRQRLLHLYAFLGPLGTLIPVTGAAPSFRLFYLMLIPGSIAMLLTSNNRRPLLRLAVLLPITLYLVGSALYAANSGVGFGDPEEAGNPLVRVMLLLALLTFTVLAAEVIAHWSLAERLTLLQTFFAAYFVSLGVGYLLFAGFELNFLEEEFVQRFQILVQYGFGLLRMSPGSYPNEYGIVSSFVLSVLLLFEVQRDRWPRSLRFLGFTTQHASWRTARFTIVLCALFLTTTRAAYVSFLLCAMYIALGQPGVGRKLKFIAALTIFFSLLLVALLPYFNALEIVIGAYEALFDDSASANERVVAWNTAFDLFRTRELFGTGFGSVDMIHNVYLQFIFELGVVGSAVFATCFGLFSLTLKRRRGNQTALALPVRDKQEWCLLAHIRNVGLIHIVWFAASNHSVNHFLTWFVILLIPLSLPPRVRVPFAGMHLRTGDLRRNHRSTTLLSTP